MMFHLLVVDDEPTIRKGLSQFIPWDSCECTVDGTACNGAEAIQMIEEFHPNIVITDVKMPQMDGIAVAKYIYENHPEIKVIMLTGYAEFTYAQSAVKYHVADFIVKPTSREKLMEAVNNCKSMILKEKNLSSMNQKDIFYLKEQLLAELTAGSLLEEKEITARLSEYQIDLSGYYMVLFQYEQEQFTQFGDNFSSIRDILKGTEPIVQVYRYNHNFVIVLYPTDKKEPALPETICRICVEAIEIISNLYGIAMTAGVSGCCFGCQQMKTACSQAITALSYGFYHEGTVSVFQPSATANGGKIDVQYLIPLFEIENALNDWNFEQAHTLVMKLFSKLRIDFVRSYDIKSIGTQIYYICSRLLMKKELDPPSGNFLLKINECITLFALQELIQELFTSVQENLCKNGKRLSPFIENAIAYINKNLNQELSLEAISEDIHIHPSHLSRTFKKECGASITDYINQNRIEKAKELLASGTTLAYEVAEQVGYHDPAYFSATFKKYTGMTPKEFKQILVQKMDS